MTHRASQGFSLVEVVIVLLIVGSLLGMSIPAIGRYSDDLSLKGATDQIASVMLMTRDRALSTRISQTVKFEAGCSGTDYRVEVGGVMQSGWKLPKRVSYSWLSGTINAVTVTPNGRCSASGLIILTNTRGTLDTVSVLSSGLVLTK